MKRTVNDAVPRSGKCPSFPSGALIEKSRSSVDSDGNWLITLSDVLSLLLVFFVMFFVMTRNAAKPEKAIAAEGPNTSFSDDKVGIKTSSTGQRIRDEMAAAIKQLDLENDISVRAVDREVVITMRERVTFRPGDAEILKSSEPMLDNIAGVILRHSSFLVEIEGHTDNVPIRTRMYPSNWELSVARATSVLKYFINVHDIAPCRLSIKGDADQRPAVPNDDPESRAKNRRVEIRLKEKGNET